MPIFLDKRGAVALEMPFVWFFVMFSLCLPLADVVIAAIRYIAAYQALDNLGAYAMLHIPPDVANTATWSWPTSKSVSGYTVTSKAVCGASDPCTSAAAATPVPKSFVFTTSFTLTPMVVTALAGPHTITYTERFQ